MKSIAIDFECLKSMFALFLPDMSPATQGKAITVLLMNLHKLGVERIGLVDYPASRSSLFSSRSISRRRSSFSELKADMQEDTALMQGYHDVQHDYLRCVRNGIFPAPNDPELVSRCWPVPKMYRAEAMLAGEEQKKVTKDSQSLWQTLRGTSSRA